MNPLFFGVFLQISCCNLKNFERESCLSCQTLQLLFWAKVHLSKGARVDFLVYLNGISAFTRSPKQGLLCHLMLMACLNSAKHRRCYTFSLPQNYTDNTERLVRRARPRVVPPLTILPAQEPISEAPLVLEAMAEKTLREFSVPSTDNVATGPNIKPHQHGAG